MSAGGAEPNALRQPYLDGQIAATSFVLHLVTSCPAGDELYHYVSSHMRELSPEHSELMRGFLRALQKRLEKLS